MKFEMINKSKRSKLGDAKPSDSSVIVRKDSLSYLYQEYCRYDGRSDLKERLNHPLYSEEGPLK